MCARVTINLDLSLLPTESRLENQGFLKLGQRVNGLATGNVVTKNLLQSRLFRADDLVNEVGFPDLVWFDLQDILPNRYALAQNQLVLIRHQAHCLGLWHRAALADSHRDDSLALTTTVCARIRRLRWSPLIRVSSPAGLRLFAEARWLR